MRPYVLTLLVLSITACAPRFVTVEKQLPAPPTLCTEPAAPDLPAPPAKPACAGEQFNTCLTAEAREHLRAANRAEEQYDTDRARRQACILYLKEIQASN